MKISGNEILNIKSGACDEDAPDSVKAVLSGCQAKQEGKVHQGDRKCQLHWISHFVRM